MGFALKRKIKSGFFFGLGACQDCVIGRYNENKKDYDWRKYKKQQEVASLTGNLATKQKKLILHIHAVLSGKNLRAEAGHLKKAVIFPTCEIMFFAFNKKIERKYSKSTGLFLIE